MTTAKDEREQLQRIIFGQIDAAVAKKREAKLKADEPTPAPEPTVMTAPPPPAPEPAPEPKLVKPARIDDTTTKFFEYYGVNSLMDRFSA